MPKNKKSESEKEVASESIVTEKKAKKSSKKSAEKEASKMLEPVNEKETKKRTSDRSVLLKELKEKAKKLQAGIEGVGTEDIKEELEKKRELLIPLEDYVKTGIHLGTRVITPDMKPFVYRRRADSIGVLNTSLIDEQIKKAIDFVSKYEPAEIVLACKREAGWKPAILFSEITGIRVFTKKYPAGMMTNTALENFYEPELVIVCDPWIDKNALNDATLTNKKKIILCDTNNFTARADLVIPCNNKGSKSLGLIFYLLARGYIEKKKIKVKMPSMALFVDEEEADIQYIQESPKELAV
ncbi:MAG TPA: 30S ribosomal protein S2 [Candidatus Nanoarchaeia archaeon]|nr:30S ribosomal protein S2 [Candidatus Nanoarchaeia archaeon]